MIDLSQSRLTPYKHQVVGVEKILANPFFLLADEMGAGKTKQTIDTIQILFLEGKIDRVLVVAPSSVRSVWFDVDFGELAKHLWYNVSSRIYEYHAKMRAWDFGPEVDKSKRLQWMITNYEFIRLEDRLKQLLPYCTPKTFLVLDESSAIKSYRAHQTIASQNLRIKCGRVILLNGTPIANNPGDLYSQAYTMDPKIFGCKNWFHFRARYAIMGGWQQKQIIGWRDLDDIQRRLAPYVLRRLKTDCLDLPPKLDSVVMGVPLNPPTWKIYKEMRDDMVAWLTSSTVSSASQAIVKTIRLSQITSGFLGGVETQILGDFSEDNPEYLGTANAPVATPVQEVGREKLNLFLDWLKSQLEEDPNLKVLVWCRFRPEVQRLTTELAVKFPEITVGKIWGGQKRDERDVSLQLLDPRTMPKGPVVVVGTPASGAMGLNLTGAHTVIYLSNDYSLKTRLQSEDRVHRPGQTYPVSYFDVIATGPDGQKTIDHAIIKALRNKEEIANWTTSAWLAALQE